ncbi:anaerobic sulfite reductase subunit AsrA [Romboutsia sp. 1001216sp1]|uniref:anaerobic sulfite reductase subunit AsrA n=1 Tax=unclassified Romboutsia TaxID=2626894 RepID=UPI0018A96890|nr:anaerobic sulfite reductase subunit AsrA [Romboutsia sp. 1001216sp1]MDB8794560.1 anaerobic sulfite reductase subunit AsrA [Romboutsia sp. 1001216sp1]MDB8796130.1 anaerobic sulfite reductase subunit AsrA [Romboutsia sp. 1001216sp1]MDB8798123.1 anaerobic sulfite reductase subunit AsrA [Romboutsia sp. 1001216sp1]MDB8803532.1 anaerobic sulfite reductase subunit AsrA [Romboutsia sp. 1001216sp1]MDB8808472.1 anaerobic sulfite reductase subunit AsrA [Romboutsia sp. 1001216sp1]
MKIKLSKENFNEKLKTLSNEYKILAPVSLEYMGTFSDTDVVRYKEVSSLDEMELNRKSNFSAKEIVFPITQILFYFTENEFKESDIDDKKLLIFLRACDINAMKRLDEIYLKNGIDEDYYYKKLREKVKFVLVGCRESFRNCFCISMDSNKTDNYSMGIKIDDNEVFLEIKDKDLKIFNGEKCEFEIDFVKENLFNIEVPQIDKINSKEISKHEMWQEYNSRCIACGRCNFVCPTCSCFTMQDVFYKENEKVGERRRIWAGCQVDGFTSMAGGHEFRKTKGERMRFKTMHKIYDFNKRFGYNMCVGCGRCDDACPQYISFSKCIEKVNEISKERE